MTDRTVNECVELLRHKAVVTGRSWWPGLAERYSALLNPWENEFGREVVRRALECPRLPDVDELRAIALLVRSEDEWRRHEPPRTPREILAESFIRAWRDAHDREPEGDDLPESVRRYLAEQREAEEAAAERLEVAAAA